MPMATNEVTIERSPEEVFAFLADGENDGRWRPGVLDVARVSGEGVGAFYRQGVRGPMGRRVAADYRVTEYEPGRALAFAVAGGPVRPRGRFDLSPAPGGTRVRFTLESELSGVKRVLMARMVARTMASEVGNLARLKEVLEA
jgi:carbon monoxide dehydrogenase subunit G